MFCYNHYHVITKMDINDYLCVPDFSQKTVLHSEGKLSLEWGSRYSSN